MLSILFFYSILFTGCNPAQNLPNSVKLKHVVLQLRWEHQFQFGGYYAADWQGFYRDEGLEVEIRSAVKPDGQILSSTSEVSMGKADFGIGGADILIAIDKGSDLHIASTIFQRSAARLYLLKNTPYTHPSDLYNLRVARRVNDLIDVELQALMHMEGLNPQKVTPYPHSVGIEEFVSGKIQVIPAYSTSLPFTAAQKGIAIKQIDPVTYGVDFYGDSIFTSGSIIEKDPKLVERFVRASLKGWEYALTHSNEIAKKISTNYPRVEALEDLLGFNSFQAEEVKNLTLFPVVDLGHINAFRWERMNQVLQKIGLVKSNIDLKHFIFNPKRDKLESDERFISFLVFAFIFTVVSLFIVFAFSIYLRKAVKQRTKDLHKELLIRQTAEADLSSKERQLSLITDNVPALIAYVRLEDLSYRFVNAKFEEMFQLPRSQIVGSHLKNILGPETYKESEKHLDLVRQGQATSYENLMSISGKDRWFNVNFVPDVNDTGKVIGVFVLSFDVTLQKQTSSELQFHSQVLLNMAEGVVLSAINTNQILFANPTLEQIFGYSSGDLMGQNLNVLLATDPLLPQLDLSQMDSTLKEMGVWKGEIPSRKKDGAVFWCLATISRYTHSHYGQVASIVVQDVTFQKLSEMALITSEEKLRITLNSMADAVISTDIEGLITQMNPIAQTLTGWNQAEALGKKLSEVFHIQDSKTHAHVQCPTIQLASTKMITFPENIILVHRTGSTSNIDASGSPMLGSSGNTVGMVLVFRDVTEKIRTEKELIKVEKLESVGILAGGLAHDFNNLLTTLFGNLELAKSHLSEEHKAFRFLKNSEGSMEKAIALTQQLLTFAKGGEPIRNLIDVGALIKESAQFSIRGSNVRLDTKIQKDLWSVLADKGQIDQVISNLVINAQQAMSNGGVITLTAKNSIDKDQDLVVITLSDEGIGISSEELKRIFDPYFSTKESGTGLGLSICHSIIHNHNGQITVDSVQNKGTTFTICLPAVKLSSEKVSEKTVKVASSVPKKVIRILVMDDDEMIQDLLAEILVELGYEVTLVKDGKGAVEAYKEAYSMGKRFGAVITDLTIPGGMGGKQAAQTILSFDSEAKIIVSSGYSNDPVMANYKAHGFQAIVSKPYHIRDLEKTLQQVTGGENL